MSNNVIPMPDSFAKLLFATQSHLGGSKVTKHMKGYVFGTRPDRVNVFDVNKTWEKFILAARAICGLKHTDDITVISSKTFGRKPVMKFAETTGTRPYTGRFIPGSFTNTCIRNSCEPRLIIASDPSFDKQAIDEAAKVNCPAIGFCNTDADLKYVDIAIPINNRSPRAIGVSFFILSRLVRYIKRGINLEDNIKEVELFFFRDAIELEKLQEEQEEQSDFSPLSNAKESGEFGKIPSEQESWN